MIDAAQAPTALYNEIDPFAAEWLRRLIGAGLVAPGSVEERSVEDLRPEDVEGPGQRHFFAGIGIWSYALRLAGVEDGTSIWTGSCPCQPFSAAGRRGGFKDPRHLWPAWFRLIRKCRPAVVVGEQVGGPAGRAWLDLVFADLEGAGYACGAADLAAASVGAPHIRQRIYWVAHADGRFPGLGELQRGGGHLQRAEDAAACGVAHADSAGRGVERSGGLRAERDAPQRNDADGCGEARGVAHANGDLGGQGGKDLRRGRGGGDAEPRPRSGGRCSLGGVGDPGSEGLEGQPRGRTDADARNEGLSAQRADAPDFWSAPEWLPCSDRLARPTQPGLFPLAHGAPARVGRLRAYGNAIVAPLAAEFLRAVLGGSRR